MSTKQNPKQVYEVTIRAYVTVDNFSGEDKPLPGLAQVMDAWEDYNGGEILAGKELAEHSGGLELDRLIRMEIVTWDQVEESKAST